MFSATATFKYFFSENWFFFFLSESDNYKLFDLFIFIFAA